MTARIIDGSAAAAEVIEAVAKRIADFKAGHMPVPGLATVLVGDDPASHTYVASKGRRANEVGMNSFQHTLPAETTQAALLTMIEGLNADDAVNGILVQMPLPKHIDTQKVIDAIAPAKDVDGLHVVNAGRLANGGHGYVPCTPLGCLHLLKMQRINLEGAEAVVIGRSDLVGKPMARLLTRENCTVTIAHSKTRDLPAVCRRADVLVAAIGKPRMIQGDWIKPGAVVLDVGINRVPSDQPGKTRLVGDVDFESAKEVAGAITPVPGGVGPLTIAMLLRNTLEACSDQVGIDWHGERRFSRYPRSKPFDPLDWVGQ